MPVLELHSVKDTSLWKQLHNYVGNNGDKELAQTLANNLIIICREATERMKYFPSLHPEYTLHDGTHLHRVTELMYKIMPFEVIKKLNPVEIALLILGAYYHDQGMVLSEDSIKHLANTTDFQVFRENWSINHPNLQNTQDLLNDPNVSEDQRAKCRRIEQELEGAMLTDFVRRNHGVNSAQFVRETFADDPRWVIQQANIVELVAKLCESHVKSAYDLSLEKGFRYDELIGQYKVNMVYLALVLRLADILDFDRDRTPDSLYKTINFRSKVSLVEWNKHRSIEGWHIDSAVIQYSMQCESPEYQRSAYYFMDWIDTELSAAHDVCQRFPSIVDYYFFNLPLKADRSRIVPKGDSYIYHDLEFSLSRDEIVKLLMTDNLYQNPSLCVRELVQNSLDALRHRRALIKRDNGSDWYNGKIELRHYIDTNGYEVLECRDNGIGMDEAIVEKFLAKAGRSYYRSPEFENERISFRSAQVDFDPVAQFGIGFLSCFMIGDSIEISTRKDHGPYRGIGNPLNIELNGIGGMITIRQGSPTQPVGTTIRILGRQKPAFFERWDDRVILIPTVRGYALNCEFPIQVKCEIPEIAEGFTILPDTYIPSTDLEKSSSVSKYITHEVNFSEVDPNLQGRLRASFLVNDGGYYVLRNSEAFWEFPVEDSDKAVRLMGIDGQKLSSSRISSIDNQTTIDGILVAGEPGRNKRELRLGSYANPIDIGYVRFILDVRGDIKPAITPARTPLNSLIHNRDPSWKYIEKLANRAYGKLWTQISEQLREGLDHNIFWQLVIIYGFNNNGIRYMLMQVIWERVAIPIIQSQGNLEWVAISELDRLEIGMENDQYSLKSDIGHVGSNEQLSRWYPVNYHRELDDFTGKRLSVSNIIRKITASMGTLNFENGSTFLDFRHPDEPDRPLNEARNFTHPLAIPYSSEINNFLSVHSPLESVNYNHPIVNFLAKSHAINKIPAIHKFIECLLGGVGTTATTLKLLDDPTSYSSITDNQSDISYFVKRVSRTYLNVNWDNVSATLHPPYLIKLQDGEDIEITHSIFEGWVKNAW